MLTTQIMDQNKHNSNSLTAGSIIAGKYEIIQALGSSFMGNQYKAVERGTNKECVLRILEGSFRHDDELLRRLSLIQNKHLLAPFESGQDMKFGRYIVRTFVSGRSLADLLKEKTTLNQLEFLDIFKQACLGLAYLRKKGILHNNLKASNLIISDDYVLMLADILPGSLERSTAYPTYLSPEACKLENLSAASDNYSLACIMYESLASNPPFSGSAAQVALSHAQEKPGKFIDLTPARKVDEQVEILIFRCLEKNPENRYLLAEDLHQDLKRIEEGESIKSLPSQSQGPPGIVVMAGIALVVVVACAAYAFYASMQSNKGLHNNSALTTKTADNKLFAEEETADKALKEKDYAQASEIYNKIEAPFSSQFGAESREHLRVLHKLAKSQLSNKEIGQARDSYSLLSEILQKNPGLSPKSLKLDREVYSIGKEFWDKEDYKAAEDAFSLAILLNRDYTKNTNKFSYELFIWEGKAAMKTDQYKSAAGSFRKAAKMIKGKFEDPENLSFALNEFGRCHVNMGLIDGLSTKDKNEATKALADALKIRRKKGDDKAAAESLELSKALSKININPGLDLQNEE